MVRNLNDSLKFISFVKNIRTIHFCYVKYIHKKFPCNAFIITFRLFLFQEINVPWIVLKTNSRIWRKSRTANVVNVFALHYLSQFAAQMVTHMGTIVNSIASKRSIRLWKKIVMENVRANARGNLRKLVVDRTMKNQRHPCQLKNLISSTVVTNNPQKIRWFT